MFTEIARLTNNLCPIDLLGDPNLRRNVYGQFFCSPIWFCYWEFVFCFFICFFFKSRTLLSSGKEGILFSFLNRKCKLRNEFPVLSLLVINSS